MSNSELARNLDQLADLSELAGANPFSVRAYRNAAATLRGMDEQVSDLLTRAFELTSIKGIGKEIAEKIRVMVETGALPQIERLAKQVPLGLLEVMRVKGIGAKQASALWRKLGVTSVAELEQAAKQGKIADLEGFGAKTQEKILRGIEVYRRNTGRLRLGAVDAVIGPLLAELKRVPSLGRLEVAGSYRRRKESVGDVDLVATATEPAAIAQTLTHHDEVAEVLGRGETKVSVLLKNGLQADLRLVAEESFGAALLYFTGSKDHNVALRQRALERGWHLNEYGLFEGGAPGKERAGGVRLGGTSEAELYELLELAFIPPELREDRGEIEAAATGTLPELITLADIRGDLHLHSDWSDGKNTMAEMVDACAARGYAYLAISDHSKAQAFVGGLDDEKLARQQAELDGVAAKGSIQVLRGLEVDILKDGSLDLSDEWLARLDIVIVSVHSHLDLPRAEQTARVVKAVSHPQVNVLAHPTARLIGERDPIDIDLEQVFAACRANQVAVELNAAGKRLDLSDVNLMAARRHGLNIVINTDAHGARGLASMGLGVDQARRAWLSAGAVINSWPAAKLRQFLAKTAG